MKDCKWDNQILQEYSLGHLDDILRKQIEVHLQKCPECRRGVAALKLLFAGLDQPSPASPSPAFDRKLSIALEKERYRRQLQRSILHVSGVVAALTCLLIMLTRFVFSYSGWSALSRSLALGSDWLVSGIEQIGSGLQAGASQGFLETAVLGIVMGGFGVFSVQMLVFVWFSRVKTKTNTLF